MNDIRDIDEMTRLLTERLNRKENEVMVFSSKQFLTAIQTSFSSISFFTQAVGGISLVVAGISILNVMMMAVTERTKEIGVMAEPRGPEEGHQADVPLRGSYPGADREWDRGRPCRRGVPLSPSSC